MPIYELYCSDCHTIFSFFSKSVNTTKRPRCPICKKKKLKRQISLFATVDKTGENDDMGDFPIDERKMEKAVSTLASEAENINEDNPMQAAQLMRKFSSMTGVGFGKGMEEALGRLEGGDDPEKIEAEMDDLIEGEEEPFVLPDKKVKGIGKRKCKRFAPYRDQTLYEM